MNGYEEQIEAARVSGASSLDLSGRMLGTLPESLAGLTALTELNLAGNELTVLPDWLGDLTALTRLDLTGNRLTALPESLGNLTALTHLLLTENRLTVLPDSLGNLTALTRLNLAGNLLTVSPESLAHRTAGEHPVNVSLQAWLDDTCTTVTDPAGLDAILDRTRRNGRSLTSEDDARSLFISLDGDQSALVWEDDSDVMLSWGPVPPGAPPGQTAADAEYAFSDSWFTDEPTDLTEEQARQAGHEFLSTGRRPTNVQWVDKP
jgi:Leucine-rich repeat (LRR) protein